MTDTEAEYEETVHGTDDFSEAEQEFAESVTLMAVSIRDMNKSGPATQDALVALTTAVLDRRKSHPAIVTDRVYAFCMSWLAGAITFNRDGGWRLKSAVAFLVGAATVMAFHRFM